MKNKSTQQDSSRVATAIIFYNRWVVRAAWALSLIAAGVTLLIAALLISDMLAREVGGKPLNAVYETVRLSMVAVVFLAIGYAEHTESHIRIEALTERLKGRPLAVLRTIGLTIGLIASAMFTVATFMRAVSSTQIHESVQGLIIFPIWPSRWLIVIGFVMLTLVFIGKVATCVRTIITGGEDLAKPPLKLEEMV